MNYRRDLQIRLQEKYRRLYKANFQSYHHEAGYFVKFIRDTPALAFIVESLERIEPDLDPETWAAEHIGYQGFELPPTDEGRAKLSWHLLQTWAETPNGAAMFGHMIDSGNDLPSGCRTATEQVVEPLVEFLQESLGQAADILYLLERYVRHVEWFERDRLHAEYESNTGRGEAVYDNDLRKFLFEQGIDHPFSQPRSASGEADVVAVLDQEDPLICEVKLFNGESYNKAYIGKGFRQAVAYANDYGKSVAYLVIVNVSDRHFELPTDGAAKDWPPRVESNGVTVFMVHVRARPSPSASKAPKPAVTQVTRADLVSEDNA
jgi:hypothetical protein